MDTPMLTARLRLRPFREGDLAALHALWSDPVVGRWVGGTHHTLRESAEELGGHLRHQDRHGFALWAAEERATGELVGEVGLQLLEGRGPEVEIGWAVSAAGRGRGLAHEASARWLQAGFEELGLERIVAVVLPGNVASRRLSERLGMHEEGVRHVYGHEHVVYAIDRPSAPGA
jgi:[ribosomal protein S5]-alanine N-acetyltransferase